MKEKMSTSPTRGNSEAKAKVAGAFKNRGMKAPPGKNAGAKYTARKGQ